MPREYPDQTYYVGAKCRLIVRFDDFGASDVPEPPKKIPQLRKGKGEPELEIVERDGLLVLTAKGAGTPSKSPTSAQGSSSDGRTHVIEAVIPIRMSVSRNGIRTADTASMEFRFGDLPFDPRVVRACAVEGYLGTFTVEEYQRGIVGEGTTLNVIPDTFLDDAGNQRSNLRFQGWVDEWETEFPEEGEPIVRLECTDNTRLLIEQDAPPKLVVAADVPIDRAVAEYLANFPQFRGIAVEYRPAGEEIPTLKDALSTTAFKAKTGPAPGGGGSSKLTVWDYITDVIGTLGHTVRFDGVLVSGGETIPTVIIQRARTLYGEAFTGRPGDAFTGRILPSGRKVLNRLFVYGRNILEMRFRRKFARVASINIEVRCYHSSRKKTLVARYPLKGDRQRKLLPGDQADEKWMVIRVRGVKDEKTLRIIAQNLYESIARNELECSFSTKNLGSFGGGNLDPDALDCLPGDTIEVEVNRETDAWNTVVGIEEQVATRAQDFLTELGYSAELAKAYAEAVSNIGFPTSFRVRTLVLDWDSEAEGITLDFETINFLEVRADKSLPEGEEPKPEDSAGVEPVRVEVE